MEGMRPDGNCRACVVEVKGERVLGRRRAAACRRPAWTSRPTARARCTRRRWSLELLKSDMPERSYKPDSELDFWCEALAVGAPRFAPRLSPNADLSHPAIAVNLDACIQCTRCVRACREEQVNDVIGYAMRGAHSEIVFDLGDPMGASTCVACGECVRACPTGALMPARGVGLVEPDKSVDSVCPYCGVGCQLTYRVKDNRIIRVDGRDGPANDGRLCVKGRYGFDYVHHPPAPDEAADPPRRCAEVGRLRDGPGRSALGVPRSDVGRSARGRDRRPAPASATSTARRR